MLDDRYYMRGPSYDSQKSATVILLIVNAVIFVLYSIFSYYTRLPLDDYFALSARGLASGFIWQPLTFQFLHAGLIHLFFNSWALYVFGRPVEEALGRKGFLQLYFTSGVLGGLLHVVGSLILPSHFGVGVVGASAGVFGLLGAYAALFPDRQITLLLFFILPVTLTARMLLIFAAALAVFGIAIPADNVAHGAHLGGLLAGLGFIRWVAQTHWKFHWPRWMQGKPRSRELVRAGSPRRGFWQAPKPNPTEDLPPEEYISREVDPILDKISAHGIQSLTERERKILEAARAKMAKRS